jgi:hypothetical protein
VHASPVSALDSISILLMLEREDQDDGNDPACQNFTLENKGRATATGQMLAFADLRTACRALKGGTVCFALQTPACAVTNDAVRHLSHCYREDLGTAGFAGLPTPTAVFLQRQD